MNLYMCTVGTRLENARGEYLRTVFIESAGNEDEAHDKAIRTARRIGFDVHHVVQVDCISAPSEGLNTHKKGAKTWHG